jgi:tetratricopeptide (TPR) repeat protein
MPTMEDNMTAKTNANRLWPVLMLICITAIVYFNSLSNGFVYDDLGTIVENTHIKRLGNYFSSFYNQSYFKISGGEATYRPVATLSYYLLYAFSDVNPFGYRLFSFALHIFNVILAYLLVDAFSGNKRVAVIAGLLFACHPVNAEAVNGISYNEDLLAAFFFFLAVLFYMRLQPAAPRPGYIFFMLSLLFFLLGLLSKEMAITLPATLVLYDIILREPVSGKISLKRVLAVLQDRKYFYAGYLGVSFFYLWVRFFVLYNPEEVETQIWGRLIDRIVYLPVIFLKYIKLSLFPFPLNADYVFSYPTRFLDPLPLISLFVVLGLVFYSFFALKNQKAVAFGIGWFFMTLFPVYNLIQIYNPFAERYLYIPLLGFCLVIAIFLEALLSRISVSRAGILRIFVVACVVGAYSLITINRNRDWKDSYSLWTQTLKVEPDSFRAHGNLARVYQKRGMLDASMREVKKTLELNPTDFKAYYNLGVVSGEQGFAAEAISAYQKTIAMNPRFKNAHFNLGTIYKAQNRLEPAKQAFKRVVEIDPDDIEARNNLGVIYAMQGKLDAAIIEWQRVLALDPANPDAQANIEKAKTLIDQSK